MITASARTDSTGRAAKEGYGDLTIGTAGHGHTSGMYKMTFHKIPSMITKSDKYNTGKRGSKGKIIYFTHKYKVLRVESIGDVHEINPAIAKEFVGLGFVFDCPISCNDLMRWQKDKDGLDVEVKKGLSFSIGDYEARLIGGKHVFLYENEIVLTLKGKAK